MFKRPFASAPHEGRSPKDAQKNEKFTRDQVFFFLFFYFCSISASRSFRLTQSSSLFMSNRILIFFSSVDVVTSTSTRRTKKPIYAIQGVLLLVGRKNKKKNEHAIRFKNHELLSSIFGRRLIFIVVTRTLSSIEIQN